MIEFTDLTKRYGKFTAVDHLTLHVPAQGAVALWGVNGAGKTTVIKCLLGLLRFDGRITVDGCDVQRQGRAARQRIGYVPQELAFYKEMTTYDMADFYARLKGVPAVRIEAVEPARTGSVGSEVGSTFRIGSSVVEPQSVLTGK